MKEKKEVSNKPKTNTKKKQLLEYITNALMGFKFKNAR